MSDLASLLADDLERLCFVDVGAHGMAEGEVFAPALLAHSLVFGFEADAAECARLEAAGDGRRRYLPYVIGDGARGHFHLCRSPLTSSLLRPNRELLEQYEGLAEVCEVVAESPVDTVRLDDVAHLPAIDFLKLDIQGATLAALEGAQRRLEHTLVVHAEVEFAALYREEPLFSECERFLRARGFMFHHFHEPQGRRVLAGGRAAGRAPSQLLWADAVFVPSFERLRALPPRSLRRLAWLLHAIYGAHDFAFRCIVQAGGEHGLRDVDAYLSLLETAPAAPAARIVANNFSDAEWMAGVGTRAGGRNRFYFLCGEAGMSLVREGSRLVFARSGAARVTRVESVAQGASTAVFVTVDRELDPAGDGYPYAIVVRPERD
jgi:FkbM family methyltransferase